MIKKSMIMLYVYGQSTRYILFQENRYLQLSKFSKVVEIGTLWQEFLVVCNSATTATQNHEFGW